MRAEFNAIQAGFDKMPSLASPGTAIVVNSSGTGLTNTVGALALAGALITTGAFNTTLIQQATVSLTLPSATTTLVGRDTSDPLTNKTYNGLTINTTTGTLAIASGKTLTVSNTLTFTGTDGSSVAFGAGGTVAYTASSVASITGTANQITASASVGAVTLSLPSTLIAPGTFAATSGAFGGATIGSNALAVTGTAAFSSTVSTGLLNVNGTNNNDSIRVYNTGATKFITLIPESTTGQATIGYWTGAAWGGLLNPGTLTLGGALAMGGNNITGAGSIAATGVTVTGTQTITGTVAGNNRALKFQTSGVDRWSTTPSFTAESGSNVGSDYQILRYSDAGSFLGTPLSINRATGIVTLESGLTITSGTTTITSASANALAVGRNGATNPTFSVDPSTASSATGINIKSAAAGGGVALSAISSGTNEDLKLDAKGSGALYLNGTATGGVVISRALSYGGVAFANTGTGSGSLVGSISPALTGSPTAPTQSAGDNSTKIATTAYVNNLIVATAPTIQKFLTGSGTYTTPAGCKWIRVRMVGAGGGGGGGNGATGNTGGNSTFGTTLLVANGGTGGAINGPGGTGGTASLGTGPVGIALSGGYGQGGGSWPRVAVAFADSSGGNGGVSPFGGAGGGSNAAAATGTTSAIANSGSGGGGGVWPGDAAGVIASCGGGGGGAGGYVDAIIAAPSATYSYAVGAAGTGGAGAAGGATGGDGGSGLILVEEHYSY